LSTTKSEVVPRIFFSEYLSVSFDSIYGKSPFMGRSRLPRSVIRSSVRGGTVPERFGLVYLGLGTYRGVGSEGEGCGRGSSGTVGDAPSEGKGDAVEASANDGLPGNPAVTTDSNEHNIIDSNDLREPAPTTAVQHDEASVLFWKKGRFVNKVAVTSVLQKREMMAEEPSRKT
jgi:hypothetical protein